MKHEKGGKNSFPQTPRNNASISDLLTPPPVVRRKVAADALDKTITIPQKLMFPCDKKARRLDRGKKKKLNRIC